jgi:two-component system sensor histidine kinase UhpB
MLDWKKSMPNAKDVPTARHRRRPVDLKRSLILRIVLVAALCLATVAAVAFVEAHRDADRRAGATADLVARQLALQLLRINSGLDLARRFPEWDTVLAGGAGAGQCVRFYSPQGEMQRGDCVGSPPSSAVVPAWFAAVSSTLYPAGKGVSRDVSYKGVQYGTVVVTSAPEVVVARVWESLEHPLLLTFLTVVSLSVLVYVALARALAPTQEVIGGLNRLAAGDFSHRLPDFRLAELNRIAEVANQLAAKIEATLEERGELSKRLMNTQEDERRHLARELHDEFGQNLSAIAALAASIERTAEEKCPELTVEARSLKQVSAGMMTALRGTLLRLRPADFERFGLVESLRQLVDTWSISRRKETRFELDIPPDIALPDNAAIQIFRIAQEGLTNAAKHADARNVRLSVEPVALPGAREGRSNGIRLTIEDDGTGRTGTAPTGNGNGMGLVNMRERVAALGGSISFDDQAGSGLKVRVVVPVNPEEQAADGHARH